MSDSESGTPGAQSPLSRRSVLKGLAGAAGLAVVPGALLEACSSSKKTATAPTSAAAGADHLGCCRALERCRCAVIERCRCTAC